MKTRNVVAASAFAGLGLGILLATAIPNSPPTYTDKVSLLSTVDATDQVSDKAAVLIGTPLVPICSEDRTKFPNAPECPVAIGACGHARVVNGLEVPYGPSCSEFYASACGKLFMQKGDVAGRSSQTCKTYYQKWQ